MIIPYPLQVDLTAFWTKDDAGSPTEIIIFIAILFGVIVLIIVINAARNKTTPMANLRPESRALTGLFSGITLRRMAKNFGLTREQAKMLDFVFKGDHVTDPEKSFATPALLDQHFKHAYRTIDQSSAPNDEIQKRLSVLFSTRNTLESSVGGGLTSTTELRSDISLIIDNGKEKYGVPIRSTNGEHLAVECPKNALGSYVKFQKGEKLSAMFFTRNNKGFSFETRVAGFSPASGTLSLDHSNKVMFLSQRRYRRKQTVIGCTLHVVVVEGSGKRQRLIVDKHVLSGSIADISVGGCSIKTKSSIQVGARLKIEFTQRNANVAALGQVLRTNRAGIVTVIHLKFLRVTLKSMNIINAFVYEYAYV